MKKDLTGQTFGRLTVTGPAADYKWQVICSCGNDVSPKQAHDLTSGRVSSCGCLRRELRADKNRTHGMSGEKKGNTYCTWRAMRKRCLDPNNEKYPKYGGAGITIDPAWDNFENFLRDMGERPGGMTLDRVRNNEGYSKNNCRWATAKEQRANQKRMGAV